MKTLMLCLTILIVLHIQPAVSQVVTCYSQFSEDDGNCNEVLGQVSFDDCCMNPKYGYIDRDGVCKSCRNAEWTKWSSWSACSVSCLTGVRQRRRACYGIGSCPDHDKLGNIQTEPCSDMNCCPADGGWSSWGSWLPCSVTCESGVKKRKRTCTAPTPICGGTCYGNNEEVADCDTGIVCPTHGGWASWGGWGPCDRTCTVEGNMPPQQHRYRTCTNPPPSTVPRGNDCPGSNKDSQGCKGLPFCPVDGNWGAWSAASACSVTCGIGRQYYHRQCNNPGPKYGGMSCNGDNTKSNMCTIPKRCPVDGSWSDWSQWSACTSSNERTINCRNRMGRRRRTRECLGMDSGGAHCPGEIVEHSMCYDIQDCPIDPDGMITGAEWSEWSKWSYCKPDCGEDSKQTREKKCTPILTKYKDQRPELFSGEPDIFCPETEDIVETRPCLNVPEC